MTGSTRPLIRTTVTACCAAALIAAGAATSPGQAAGSPGTTTRVSVTSSQTQADGPTYGSSAMSANGRYVVFTSEASNLVPGDTNGVSDVFVRDLSAGTTRRISVSSAERQADTESLGGVAITPTGRYVAFTSTASNLVAHDTNGNRDVFVRDLAHGTTRRVSLTDAGRQGRLGGDAPAISADGRYVAFMSFSDNLVPRDTNRHGDVFVRDRSRGTTRRVSVTTAEKQVYLGGRGPGDLRRRSLRRVRVRLALPGHRGHQQGPRRVPARPLPGHDAPGVAGQRRASAGVVQLRAAVPVRRRPLRRVPQRGRRAGA
jgi:hypothetical protein